MAYASSTSRRLAKRVPRARHLPTHEIVGLPEDEFGKWVHYKQHTVGEFRFQCNCGHDIQLSVRVEKEYGARIFITHRSARRQFTSEEPKAMDFLERIDMVTKFKGCGTQLPWVYVPWD